MGNTRMSNWNVGGWGVHLCRDEKRCRSSRRGKTHQSPISPAYCPHYAPPQPHKTTRCLLYRTHHSSYQANHPDESEEWERGGTHRFALLGACLKKNTNICKIAAIRGSEISKLAFHIFCCYVVWLSISLHQTNSQPLLPPNWEHGEKESERCVLSIFVAYKYFHPPLFAIARDSIQQQTHSSARGVAKYELNKLPTNHGACRPSQRVRASLTQ